MTGRKSTEMRRGLRLLVAAQEDAGLRDLAGALEALGHEVTAVAALPEQACALVARDDPDAAVVDIGDPAPAMLDLVGDVARAETGPVIAVLANEQPSVVAAAAERGVFAYVRPVAQETLQGALEVALRRHAETERLAERVDELESAIERRALIERAKGVLMERHDLEDEAAFDQLRRHARSTNSKVVAVAGHVVEGAEIPLPARALRRPSAVRKGLAGEHCDHKDVFEREETWMIGLLIAVLVAAVVYLFCTFIGLPYIVAVIAAILVLLAGIPSGGFGFGTRYGGRAR